VTHCLLLFRGLYSGFREPAVDGARPGSAPDAEGIRRSQALVANQGKPLNASKTSAVRLGPEYGEETENLRVVINQLRKKSKAIQRSRSYIRTEPWVGYRFQPPRGNLPKSPSRK